MSEPKQCAACGGLMIPEEIGSNLQSSSARLVCSRCGSRRSTTDKAASKFTILLIEVGLIGFGAVLIYFFGYGVYLAIQNREETLELSLGGLLFGSIFLSFGLGLGLASVVRAIRKNKAPAKWFQWVFFSILILGCAAGFIGYFWLRQIARDAGYAF